MSDEGSGARQESPPPRRARRARGAALAFLVAATLCWAVNYVGGAAALDEFSPLELTASRWVLAAPVLLVLAAVIERPDWRAVRRAVPRLAVLALIGVSGYNLLLYSALEYTTPSGAALVNAANPGLILLGGALIARVRLRGAAVAGLLLGLVGVLIVLLGGEQGVALSAGPGEGLMVLAILAWTVYSLAGRWIAEIPPITATAMQAAVVAVVFGPLALVVPGPAHDGVGPAGLVALLVVALLPSVGSYLLWNSALRTIPAVEAGVFLNLITVFVVAIGAVTGSLPSVTDLIGGGMILIGVYLGQRSNLRTGGGRSERSPVEPGDASQPPGRDG
ncbi:MAG: DMT family transporter [Naasia sp.]